MHFHKKKPRAVYPKNQSIHVLQHLYKEKLTSSPLALAYLLLVLFQPVFGLSLILGRSPWSFRLFLHKTVDSLGFATNDPSTILTSTSAELLLAKQENQVKKHVKPS